jgi:hypothetical protein
MNHFQRNSPTRTGSRVSGTRGRRLVAIWLAAAVLCLPLSQTLKAGESTGMKPSGGLTTRGVSRIDGMEAISGETIFSGSNITTEQNATATVSLGKLGRVEILSDSGLWLDFGETGVTGTLATGGVDVSLPAGVPGAVTTGEASVIANGNEPALFSVTTRDDETIVTAQAGQVQVRAFGKTQQLTAGQTASAGHSALNLNPSQPQIPGAQNLSGRAKAGIIAGIGGAIAIVWWAIARNDNNNCTPVVISPSSGLTQCI